MESNVTIETLEHKGAVYRLNPPLVLEVDFEKGLFLAVDEELGIYVSGKRMESLKEEFSVDIDFLWKEYALEEDENLTEDAVGFKKELLKRITCYQLGNKSP